MKIYSRSEIGLPPSKADRANLSRHATVHYSTGRTMGRADTMQWVRDIYRFHTEGRGWSDIAYHYLFDRFGRIFEGRPLDRRGAHAGSNSGNLTAGLCFLGDDSPNFRDITPEAETSLRWLLTDHLPSRLGGSLNDVFPHSHWKSTGCPGDELRGLVRSGKLTTPANGTPQVRTLEQAVVGLSAVDLEHGRVLARTFRWALVQGRPDQGAAVFQEREPVQVKHAIRVGQAVGFNAGFESATDLAGDGRDDTAYLVGRTIVEHPPGSERRRGAPW